MGNSVKSTGVHMMNLSWREKSIKRWKKIGKKSKLLKSVSILMIFAVISVDSIYNFFTCNTKRFGFVLALCLVFVVSSSFCFPEYGVITDSTQEEAATITPLEMTADELLSEQADLLLDDRDVIDGYENSELENQNIDSYSIEEILKENSEGLNNLASNQSEDDSTQSQTIFSKDDWRLILINKQHPVPEDYTFELGNIKGSMKCDARIVEDLLLMLQAAKQDGINIMVCSPYRDLNRQEVLFERKINAYMAKGYSYLEAYKITSMAVTVPGASEHQIGLALDLICDKYTYLNEGFGETEAGKWLAANSHEYGFILRYPKEKEDITGIEYEPWHFRYVGKDAAGIIMSQKITLEEFVENL